MIPTIISDPFKDLSLRMYWESFTIETSTSSYTRCSPTTGLFQPWWPAKYEPTYAIVYHVCLCVCAHICVLHTNNSDPVYFVVNDKDPIIVMDI